MRERNVQMEFTAKECVLQAEAFYLATLVLRNPEHCHKFVKGNHKAEEAVNDILGSPIEWTGLLAKMIKSIMNTHNTEGL